MKRLAILIVLTVCLPAPTRADVVLTPLKAEATRGPNRLRNAGFEAHADGKPTGWTSHLAADWTVDTQVVHAGQASLRMAKTAASTLYWVSQTVELNQTRAQPLVVGAWSKADGVEGSRGAEYSVWVDLVYQDGTSLWGQRATFDVGTHDWQHSEQAFVVSKPVRHAQVNLLFRNGLRGTVWFDDVSLQELEGAGGMLFDRSPAVVPAVPATPAGAAQTTIATGDGLSLQFDPQGRLCGLHADDQPLLGSAPGGLWLRDVAAAGAWLRPECTATWDDQGVTFAGTAPEAGLRLESRWQSTVDGIDVLATVHDLTHTDRAVTAYFVLPLADRPWVWHEDILRSTTPAADGEYAHTSGWPISGLASAYPYCSVTAGDTGLSLSVPMDSPRIFRLVYNSSLNALYVAVNLGLTADTANFPSRADFRFSLYRHDPAWGFRAATAKYYQRHPQFFVQRLQQGGIWMAFADISAVPDWQDFGFAYDENSATPLQFDNDNGIASFRYIEPMTYWLPMAEHYPRTYAGALQALHDNLAQGNASQKRSAQITLRCGVYTRDNQLDLSLQNQAWCDGAVFTLNPDPNIKEDAQCPVNKGRAYYTPEWADKQLMQQTGPRMDGIYLDSLPNWGEVRNYRREHWRTATVPLTFDPDTKQPVLLQMFSTWQYAQWIAEDVHRRGGLMHGNGGTLWPFFPALLDVTGQETGGILNAETMAMARTLLRNKPYSPLLNTQFAKLPPTYMEEYFHRSALYCIFPSFFNGDVLEDGKWKTVHFFKDPALYERARSLYKQFIPVLRRMFAAGWDPVTYARALPAEVQVERYGPGAAREVLFAVFNPTQEPAQVKLTVPAAELKLDMAAKATALLAPADLPVLPDGDAIVVTVPVAAGRCEVVSLAP